MPKPSLTCVNNSEQHGSFAIFRDGPPNQDQEPPVLVWMAYPVAPGSEVTLTWLEDYSFVWSESGTVTPDASFVARQVLPADLNERNHVQLTVDSLGAPMFQALGSGGQPGALTVEILQNVVPDRIQVGFGLSGLAVHTVAAQPNTTTVFTPASTSNYWVGFGNFRTGEPAGIVASNVVEVVPAVVGQNPTATLMPDGIVAIT